MYYVGEAERRIMHRIRMTVEGHCQTDADTPHTRETVSAYASTIGVRPEQVSVRYLRREDPLLEMPEMPEPMERITRTTDPRLPPPGTQLTREFRGRTIVVDILEDGFLCNGRRYKSLSAIATAVAGGNRSGFVFFNLGEKQSE